MGRLLRWVVKPCGPAHMAGSRRYFTTRRGAEKHAARYNQMFRGPRLWFEVERVTHD